jgi:hypothetical protein
MKSPLTVFLFSIFIWLVPAGQGRCAQSDVLKLLEEEEPLASEQIETIQRPRMEYKSENAKDPFRALTGSQSEDGVTVAREGKTLQASDFTVQGIILGPRFNQAIIDDKVVKIGDTLEEAEIVSIDKTGIIMLFEGEQISLARPAKSVE